MLRTAEMISLLEQMIELLKDEAATPAHIGRLTVRKLRVQLLPSGRGVVSINDDKAFHVPPKLAMFILALGTKGAGAWVRALDIVEYMAQNGQPIKKEAVVQLKYRLRLTLNGRGYSPELVEYDAIRGAVRINIEGKG